MHAAWPLNFLETNNFNSRSCERNIWHVDLIANLLKLVTYRNVSGFVSDSNSAELAIIASRAFSLFFFLKYLPWNKIAQAKTEAGDRIVLFQIFAPWETDIWWNFTNQSSCYVHTSSISQWHKSHRILHSTTQTMAVRGRIRVSCCPAENSFLLPFLQTRCHLEEPWLAQQLTFNTRFHLICRNIWFVTLNF